MGVIGRWGGYTFEVSPSVVRSFSDLSIKGSSETEEKESGGEKYVARKSGKPSEVSLTVQLHAMLGCNVRAEAMGFVEDATNGKRDYFYVGSGKLFVPSMMLTEASVSKVVMSPDGTWLSADVKLTLKQCEKRVADVPQQSYDDGGGSGSSGSKKATTKTTVPATALADEVSQVLNVSKSIREANKANSSSSSKSASSASAVASAKKTTDTAKTASAASKQTPNTSAPRSQTVKNSDKISAM